MEVIGILKLTIIRPFDICISSAYKPELGGTVMKPLLIISITVSSKMTLSGYGIN
jgi:hypothetical protein